MAGRRTAVSLVALVAGASALSLLPGAAPPASAAGLVPFGSCEELLAHHREQLLRAPQQWAALEQSAVSDSAGGGRVAAPAPVAAAAGEAAGGAAGGVPATGGDGAVGSGGPTGTNLQEQDVDEPDLAKLRDGRAVVLTGGRLSVVTASATPTVVSSLAVSSEQEWASELLLVGDRAVVVAQGWREGAAAPAVPGDARTMLFAPGTPTTTLVLVDLARPEQPRVLERATWDGHYLSARLVDGTVRLVTSSAPVFSPVGAVDAAGVQAAQAAALTVEQVLPRVVRTSAQGDVLEDDAALGCGDVAHAAGDPGTSTLLVTTLRPGSSLQAVDSTGVTASGELVYASSDRLYVGTSQWGTTGPVPLADDAPDQVTTQLHAFDTMQPESTTYVGTGEVPGYVYGRWALSEHDGALRVATTRQPPWEGGGSTSSSLFVLAERDGALVETGRVDGLGKTEQIKAVRYFGDTAAVVTFRQTDPLYLLDLSDPTAPRVTGELKIPGFSTYLHPLGDGLLLGVGQDATDTGQVTGVQLSTFDVRDPAAPTQIDRLSLGAGYSPALDDSRAFGYDAARRLAVLPFLTWDQSAGTAAALGVGIGADGALREVGRLQVDPTSPTERVLLAGDVVLSVAQGAVVAGDAATFTRTGAVSLPR